MTTPEERLKELGINLPVIASPGGNYMPYRRVVETTDENERRALALGRSRSARKSNGHAHSLSGS
jgi:hypothetical protein